MARSRVASPIAAVDLGSNSFHLVVARDDHGEPRIVDRMQEMVRLAGGLDDDNRLDPDTMHRALACLARFGERLREIPAGRVRAVGTNTLRRARHDTRFLARASRALGHPIEVISGREEARLIYQGVSHSLPRDCAKRLVLDIGGGSTEVILGRGHEPLLLESLYIGCVGTSRNHFQDGRITRARWKCAVTDALVEFEPLATPWRKHGWGKAYGSSGSVRAIASVLGGLKMGGLGMGALKSGKGRERVITRAALAHLRDRLLSAGRADALTLPGLTADRAPVFAGGVAILWAAFEALDLAEIGVSEGALREGLLHDLIGRMHHDDVREHTITALSSRYHVDAAQATRVARTARLLYTAAARDWQLTPEQGQWLTWAARLHEIGLAIAHSKYHRHGAYLVEHSDLAGFSQDEQRVIAALIRVHRRRFSQDTLADLMPAGPAGTRLAILLRLAVLLNRARRPLPQRKLKLRVNKREVSLTLPRGWLARNPLMYADLELESGLLRVAGVRLRSR